MIHVFTFLGEFGYELLNWQGVVRRFAASRRPGDRIVCAGRAGLAAFYESAERYVDVSDEPLYRESVACGYFAVPPAREATDGGAGADDYGRRLKRPATWVFDRRLRGAIRRRVGAEAAIGGERVRWVFSSGRTRLRGLTFGARRLPFGTRWGREGDIYDRLYLANNLYRRIEADEQGRARVRARLGAAMDEPFVLVQTRSRAITVRSTARVDPAPLVAEVARRCRVVLLTFDTGRALDSASRFAAGLPGGAVAYACRSFPEQAALVEAARHCLFFTEGDFGSHIYIPPFMGRDVSAVAPREVYDLGTTPLETWNRGVFTFGGRIRGLVAEDVLGSAASVSGMADAVVGG